MQNRTVVVIAHRLGTVRRANRIAVLEDGRITALGPHEELLTTSPTYQRLYQLQFMDTPDSPADIAALDPLAQYPLLEQELSTQRQGNKTNADLFDDRVCPHPGSRARSACFTRSVLKSVNHRFLDLQLRLPAGPRRP